MDPRTIGVNPHYQGRDAQARKPLNAVGEDLRRKILARYGTQRDAAAAWGVHGSYVSSILLGKRAVPKWMREELG